MIELEAAIELEILVVVSVMWEVVCLCMHSSCFLLLLLDFCLKLSFLPLIYPASIFDSYLINFMGGFVFVKPFVCV